MERTVGSSKVQPNYRITLVRKIRERLEVEVGDIVLYVEDERGNIVLKKGELRPL